jgi:hypothetical protein
VRTLSYAFEADVMWIDADMKFSIDRFSFLLKRVVENKIRETELHHRDDLSFLDSLARSITFERCDVFGC